MAGILDLIDPRLLTSEDAPSAEGEFSKGMRSGTLGMRSQASNFLGAAGEKLGFQNFAQDQYAQADALGMRAGAAAPRVNTWRDIGKEGNYLRDTGDYVAGTLGQLVPSAAVGIGAGLAAPAVGLGSGALGAIAAGTAAYAPLETGDAVGRMREAGQPVDLGRAAAGGTASALGQSLVPGLVGAKLAGRVASRAPTSLLRTVGTDAGLEAGTEFGGELAKQLGSTQTTDTLDYGAATDNAVAGALGGGVMGGVGHVAQRAHQNVGAVGQGLDTVKNAATGLYGRAKGAVAESDVGKAAANVGGQAAEKLDGYEIPETISGLFKDAKDGTSRALKQMANSEDFIGDAKQFMKDSATASKEKLQSMLADNDKSAVQRAQDVGTELMNDNLSPETREKLAGAMSNLGDKVSRAFIATTKLTKDGYTKAVSSAKEFANAFKDERAKSADGVKKSEDESAFYGRISEHVTPVLQELRPDLFEGSGPEHDKLMRGVMSGIRKLITTVANGDRVEGDQLTALMQFTQGKADKLISAAYKVVDTGDKKQAKNVLDGINAFADAQRGHGSLTKTIQDSLLPEHAKTVTPAEVNQIAYGLWKWASTANKAQGDPRFLLKDREVREQLQAYFGDKTDTVMAAIEKEHARTQSSMGDEVVSAARAEFDSDETMGDEVGPSGETNPTGEEGLTTTRTKSVEDTADTIQIFAKGGKELYEKPGEAKVAKDGKTYDHPTVQAMRKAELRYPDMGKPEWIGAGELGMDHPLVKKRYEALLDSFLAEPEMTRAEAETRAKKAVENFGVISVKGTKQETRIGEHELPHVLLDTSKTSHLESPARIDTVGKGKPGNTVIDAIRLTNFMERRLHDSKDDWSARDEKGAQHRKARMFMEGIAAVQDHLQVSFEIPDSTVLEKTKRGPDGEILRNKDGSPKGVLTWEKARKLLALGKDDETLARDAAAAGRAYLEKQAEHDTLQAGRPLRKDGKRAWYPRGSDEAKALTRTGYEVERAKGKAKFTQEQVHRAAMYRLIDEAGQADGGYATNKTLLDIAEKISDSQPEVAKLLREKVRGREEAQDVADVHEGEGRYEAGSDQSVTRAMAGGNRKDAQIRTDASGLPRSESTIGYSEPAKVLGKDPDQRAWAKWVDDTLRLPTAAETIATIKELDKDQLMKVKARLNHLSGMLGSDGLRGIGPLRLKQYTTQVDAVLARLDAASAGSGARRVDRRQAVLAARAAPPGESDLTLRGDDAEGSLPGTDQPYPPRPQAGPGEGATKSPKAVAAKKAALSKEAASGDPALLKELSTSTDAKGLQRAVEHLNAGEADANTSKAIDTANERLSELVRGDEGVAYGLQTKKYSLMGFLLHTNNGYSGFPATHDSPIRHEGRFDWRTHAGKGEGAMFKGAGTYLSTSESVNKYYKGVFTAKVEPEYNYVAADRVNRQFIKAVGARTEVSSDAAKIAVEKGKGEAVAFVQQTLNDHFKDGPEATISQAEFDKWTERYEKLLAAIQAMPESEMRPKRIDGFRNDKSPTYEVSVNIPQEQLLDWDKPLSKQSAAMQKAALEASKKFDLDLAGPFGKGDEFVLGTRGEDFYRALSDHFAPGDRDTGDRQASDYLQAAGILGHRMKASAKDGAQNPNYVIYDDSKITTNYVHFSQQDASKTDPNSPGASAADRQAALDHIAQVAPWVQAAFYKHVLDADGNSQVMTHAGEFERVLGPTGLTDVMRLSMYSMTPRHHAYHESLHAFFAKLRDLRQGGVMDVLEKAGSSAPVMNQLKKLLAGEPEALKQLNNPEERAAYMYQFWSIKDANGKRMLTVGEHAKNVLQRIADFIRSALGIWSNDERALKTMEYLHSGEFAKDLGKRGAGDVVSRKLIESGRNQTLQTARRMTQPFLDIGSSLGVAGGQRLRDTGIPALRELADAMKLHGTAEGTDHGFLPAAHQEHMQRMNALAHKLKGVDPVLMRAALESLQSKSNDPITALPSRLEQVTAKQAKRLIREHLDATFDYMRDAGVKVNDLGYGKDYFPRVYDTAYISKHQDEFQAVLAKHGVSDALGTMRRIMVADGNEFMVEVDKPGMQHLKERKLGFIPDDELAPFMKKDMLDVLNSYTVQATRRAEWARRFKDDGSRISQLLMRAKREGATDEQLQTADKFIRSVDGTLGDTINPEARRLMGNMMVYQNIRLLPLAVFSSVVDPMGVVVNGGSVGDAFNSFKRGLKEVIKPFKKNPKDDEATRFAEDVGVIDSAMLADALSGMYLQGMAGDTARRINDGFFKWNLMSQWNRSMRVGATEAAMGFLRKHADGKASKHSQRFLNELGLQPGELQLDARGRVKVTQADGLSLEQSAKVKAAINRWVDGAVLRPDAVDKPIWMSDPHFALIAHLKQFVYSFHETILKRVAHEYQNGNYAPAMALASYVPIMLAADLAKGLIQGGGEQPEWKAAWGIDDYLLNATERAGLFGTGQFAIDALNGGVGALAGPTLEQLGSAIQVMGGAREFAPFVLKSMPANALYGSVLESGGPDPKYKL